MKKGVVLLVISLMLLSSIVFVSANLAENAVTKTIEAKLICLDSDGDNQFIKGTVNYTYQTTETVSIDKCAVNGKDLIEYLCTSNRLDSKQYKCEKGCKDGACVSTIIVATQETSTTPSTASSVETAKPTIEQPKLSWWDKFLSFWAKLNGKVITGEITDGGNHHCSTSFAGTKELSIGTTPCSAYASIPSGCISVSGKGYYNVVGCVDYSRKQFLCYTSTCTAPIVKTSCTDSDDGKDYYVRGMIKTTDNTGMISYTNDTCIGSNSQPSSSGTELAEYSCVNGKYSSQTPYTCPNGCSDGACIKVDKLAWPIGCKPGLNCRINNYPDINKDGIADSVSRFKNGMGTQGHQGTDIDISFQQMDAGMPVYAAMDGQVLWVFNGKYDRCQYPNTNKPDCKDPTKADSPGLIDNFKQCTNLGPYCSDGNPANGQCFWCFYDGNAIFIKHTNSLGIFITEYAHLKNNSILVKPGDYVTEGQRIGLVGSSGKSTNPHLHFDVWKSFGVPPTWVTPKLDPWNQSNYLFEKSQPW